MHFGATHTGASFTSVRVGVSLCVCVSVLDIRHDVTQKRKTFTQLQATQLSTQTERGRWR